MDCVAYVCVGTGLRVGSMTRTPPYSGAQTQDVSHSWGYQLLSAKTTLAFNGATRGAACAALYFKLQSTEHSSLVSTAL